MIIDYIKILWHYRHFKNEKCLDVMHCLWKLAKCKLLYELSTGPNLHASYKYRSIKSFCTYIILGRKGLSLRFKDSKDEQNHKKDDVWGSNGNLIGFVVWDFFFTYKNGNDIRMVIEITSRYMYIRSTTNLLTFKVKI